MTCSLFIHQCIQTLILFAFDLFKVEKDTFFERSEDLSSWGTGTEEAWEKSVIIILNARQARGAEWPTPAPNLMCFYAIPPIHPHLNNLPMLTL